MRVTAARRRRDFKTPGLRWPKWLDDYAVWHPLHSIAYDVYKEEAFAREARRYKASRGLLATAYEQMKRFEDTSLPQRVRVAAGERAAGQFAEARHLARERKAELEGRLFGDTAVACVSMNDHPTGAFVAPRFSRTIVDREMARQYGARPTGRRGSVLYRGRRLRGSYARTTVVFDERSAEITVFVPRDHFAKGFLLGRDWVERTGVRIVDGEVTLARARGGRRSR